MRSVEKLSEQSSRAQGKLGEIARFPQWLFFPGFANWKDAAVDLAVPFQVLPGHLNREEFSCLYCFGLYLHKWIKVCNFIVFTKRNIAVLSVQIIFKEVRFADIQDRMLQT